MHTKRSNGRTDALPMEHMSAVEGFSVTVLGIAKGGQSKTGVSRGQGGLELASEALPPWPLERGDCLGWHASPSSIPFGDRLEGKAVVRWASGDLPYIRMLVFFCSRIVFACVAAKICICASVY